MINILIVDDHPVFREGVKQMLGEDETITVVGEAGNGVEAIEALKKTKTNIILLDINMPQMDGYDVLKYIRKEKWNIKVIILTCHRERQALLKCIELGCNGYLIKTIHFKELKDAVYIVNNGGTYYQPILSEINNEEIKNQSVINKLSCRETEVLTLIVEGMFNKEIAVKLNISERTVKNHITNIFKKLDAVDRTQAAVIAIKYGIV